MLQSIMSLRLLPLALLLSSLSSPAAAHAAPPNPDQMYALQQSARLASKLAPTDAALLVDSQKQKESHGGGVRNALNARQHIKVAGRMRKQLLNRAEKIYNKRDDSPVSVDDSDLEVRGEQYTLYSSSSSSSSSTSASSAATTAQVKSTATSTSISGYWKGASSYYLYALADQDRYTVLDALAAGGFKVVRIFIAEVGANNKGSNNVQVNDLEPDAVGVYDDTILNMIDQLMHDCSVRGLKLLIAMSDRYALGFWSTDVYATTYKIAAAGSTGVQKITNAGAYYTNPDAIAAVNARISHILNHKNTIMGGQTWAELDEVIYALEPQNEPQGYMAMASESWVCDRAAYTKSLLPSGSKILLSSGGGITLPASFGTWATSCDSIDVISVHDYGTNPGSIVSGLQSGASSANGKTVMLGEWGITGPYKAQIVQSFVAALKNAGIPWMYWEVVKPGKASSDFEVWTDEPAWQALTGGVVPAASSVPTTAAESKASAATVAVTPKAAATAAATTPKVSPVSSASPSSAPSPASAASSASTLKSHVKAVAATATGH